MKFIQKFLLVFLVLLISTSQFEIPKEVVNKYYKNLTKDKVKNPFFGIQNQNQPNQEIPLKFINYDVIINDSLAEIEIKQVYQNNYENDIQTQYYFAIPPDAVFTELKAKINDKILIGTIKEKQKAKKEYEDAIKEGKQAAYAEIVEEVHDIMKLQIGNLRPNEQIEITFKYLEPLEIEQNKLWRFQLGNTFSQRSINQPIDTISQNLQEVCNPPYISQNDKRAYKMGLNVQINSTSKITFLESPSHKIKKNFSKKEENNEQCQITFENEEEIPNKEFILLYKNENFHKPSVLISYDSENQNSQFPYAAQLTFQPDFNSQMSEPQAYNRFIKKFYQNLSKAENQIEDENEEEDFTQSETKGEYIFVVDRSGSMNGLPIDITKQALIQSIQLLSENHYFNVISFGSYFDSLFQESVQANKENKDKAISQIKDFQANYGGTNIFTPLQQVLTQKQLENQQRSIFLISDGQDYQEDRIIQSITSLVNQNNQRVYSLGIGNGVSKNLIKLAAQQGQGKFDFVTNLNNEEDLKQKLLYLFKDSITPFLSNFQIEFFSKNGEKIPQNQQIDLLIPSPASIQSIRKNEPFQLYFLFQGQTEISKIKLSHYHSQSDKILSYELSIPQTRLENPDFKTGFLQKIALHKFIRQILNNSALEQASVYQGTDFNKKFQSVEEIVDISVQYQILTDFTAFILVDENSQKDNDSKEPELVTVPQIQPHGNNIDQNILLAGQSVQANQQQVFHRSEQRKGAHVKMAQDFNILQEKSRVFVDNKANFDSDVQEESEENLGAPQIELDLLNTEEKNDNVEFIKNNDQKESDLKHNTYEKIKINAYILNFIGFILVILLSILI